MEVSKQFVEAEKGFDPHDIKAMSMALEDVCKALKVAEGTKTAREVIAGRIIELARGGERSPTKLRDRLLEELDLAGEPLRWSGC